MKHVPYLRMSNNNNNANYIHKAKQLHNRNNNEAGLGLNDHHCRSCKEICFTVYFLFLKKNDKSRFLKSHHFSVQGAPSRSHFLI